EKVAIGKRHDRLLRDAPDKVDITVRRRKLRPMARVRQGLSASTGLRAVRRSENGSDDGGRRGGRTPGPRVPGPDVGVRGDVSRRATGGDPRASRGAGARARRAEDRLGEEPRLLPGDASLAGSWNRADGAHQSVAVVDAQPDRHG